MHGCIDTYLSVDLYSVILMLLSQALLAQPAEPSSIGQAKDCIE